MDCLDPKVIWFDYHPFDPGSQCFSLFNECAVFIITMATIRHYNLRRDHVGRLPIVRVLYRDGAYSCEIHNLLTPKIEFKAICYFIVSTNRCIICAIGASSLHTSFRSSCSAISSTFLYGESRNSRRCLASSSVSSGCTARTYVFFPSTFHVDSILVSHPEIG